METFSELGELLKLGFDGVMLCAFLMLWKAYQLEVSVHLDDLRKFVRDISA